MSYNSNLQTNNTNLQDIITKINNLPNAGGGSTTPKLQSKTVTPAKTSQTVSPDSGYDGLNQVTVNAMPTATQATPAITINSNGLITATATQTAGYVDAGTKSATKQLAFQAAKTITPNTADQIAVAGGYYTGGNITVKGDANLVAGNIKQGTNIFGVTGTYAGSGGSGDTSMEDALVTRNFTSYTNDRVTTVGSYAFYWCLNLRSVNFPQVTTIGDSAFYNCNLTSVRFPQLTTIGSYAFCGCYKLTLVSFSKVTAIGNYAFNGCTYLTSINFPQVTTIGNYAFQNCFNLTSISFPQLTTIGSSAFYACNKLTSVSFPKVITIGNSAFYQCSALTSVSFPQVTTIGNYAFRSCANLTSISFPKVTTIGSYVFFQCSILTTIYLTNSSVCKLSNSNAFSTTGIGNTTGSIFVPASLVSAYKSATNWAYFANRIFGI